MDITRGRCVHIISGKSFVISGKKEELFEGKTWWDLTPTMILVPASSWAELKKYIIKNCKRTGKCDKEISNWENTIETIDKTISR
jgi:hypothetical protein